MSNTSDPLGAHPRHKRGELGYWLGVPFWNQGYMTEAANVVVSHAFATLNLHRVEAMILPRNGASIRVAEKAGLVYEGMLRHYVVKGDVFEDVAIYGRVQHQGVDSQSVVGEFELWIG